MKTSMYKYKLRYIFLVQFRFSSFRFLPKLKIKNSTAIYRYLRQSIQRFGSCHREEGLLSQLSRGDCPNLLEAIVTAPEAIVTAFVHHGPGAAAARERWRAASPPQVPCSDGGAARGCSARRQLEERGRAQAICQRLHHFAPWYLSIRSLLHIIPRCVRIQLQPACISRDVPQ